MRRQIFKQGTRNKHETYSAVQPAPFGLCTNTKIIQGGLTNKEDALWLHRSHQNNFKMSCCMKGRQVLIRLQALASRHKDDVHLHPDWNKNVRKLIVVYPYGCILCHWDRLLHSLRRTWTGHEAKTLSRCHKTILNCHMEETWTIETARWHSSNKDALGPHFSRSKTGHDSSSDLGRAYHEGLKSQQWHKTTSPGSWEKGMRWQRQLRGGLINLRI